MRDFIIMFSGGEETGMLIAKDMTMHHRDLIDAEFALNSDGGGVLHEQGQAQLFALQTAEKSYASFEISTQGASVPDVVLVLASARRHFNQQGKAALLVGSQSTDTDQFAGDFHAALVADRDHHGIFAGASFNRMLEATVDTQGRDGVVFFFGRGL